MKFIIPIAATFVLAASAMAQVPKIFAGLFEPDKPVKGQIGMVVPPEGIAKYLKKVSDAAQKNPEWFKEYSSKAKPGVPLPFHENLGLTQQEYDDYLALWAKRAFKPSEEVVLVLHKRDNTWAITASGGAGVISTLRYDPAKDVFQSPSGEMKRIEDIDAPEGSILGAWKGHEWKYTEETGLGKSKYNFAIGRYVKPGYGLLVYRGQEVDFKGKPLLDDSLVVRFALGKAGLIQAAPAKKGK